MPRPSSNSIQIAIRVPPEWLDEADMVAVMISRPGFQASRTDGFRAALAKGFEQMAKEAGSARVSAYDGKHSTCLFWFGDDIREAKEKAKALAVEHVGGRWTCFRVFQEDLEDPVFVAMVKAAPAPKAKR